ncbi:hypothetical protein Ahy_A10g050493 [Arachis hypogaea]|uniref:SWIM-type domain-containing protein n=1 Tax=Arachis hypogaea TaxID=3818 RepID=A0A445B9J0_ARAHY|nr:hypothetical protein Ahy_A10g050493 [Arachis hypogaea]
MFMAESQEKCVSSDHPPLITSPSRNSLMEVDIVEPLECVASDDSENFSYEQEDLAGDVAGHAHEPSKAAQLSDVTDVRSDEMELGDELQMAHDFYVTYAKKAGFATKIRMTTFDKITKAPINQAIHCNLDGIRKSRVKAPTRKNTISAAGCKARIYVKFDKDVQDWVLLKVDLTHSHPCSPKKVVHYHEYRQLTMHAKCVIEDNDEAGIRPNKTFLALSNEAGGPSNLGFSEKDLRNYITARLRTSNVNADVREMMSYFRRMKDINPNFFYAVKVDDECKFKSAVWVDARCRASYEYYGDVVSVDSTYSTNSWMFIIVNIWMFNISVILDVHFSEKQFQQEYTTSIFRDVQIEFVRKANCRVSAVDEQDPLVCVKVEEEKLLNDTILCVQYDVHFDHFTQELHCECNLFESSGVLCCHCLEVFHSNSIAACCFGRNKGQVGYAPCKKEVQERGRDSDQYWLLEFERCGVDDIQGPSKVTTRGRPKSKRLGYALEKSIKNSRRRKQKNSPPVVRPHTFQDINHCAVSGLNVPEQAGGFMSLLSSFNKKWD